jgi:uncharacterized membrane protein
MTASTVSPLRAEPVSASPLPPSVRRWIWAVALLLVAVFVAHAAQRFLVFTEASYRNLWPNRAWLLPHFIGGAIALLAGIVQFWAGLRRRHPRVHRWIGRVYLASVVVGAGSAFVLSFRAVLGWPFGTATFVMACAWTLATVMAFVAIRRGQVAAHREWMLRSYVVAFGFVWFRVMVVSPLFAGLGSVPERLTVLLWLSWTVPLLLAELVLQWPRSVSTPASLGARLEQAGAR